MRTARMLKRLSFLWFFCGAAVSMMNYHPAEIEFWVIFLGGAMLMFLTRLFANIGQIAYDIKAMLVKDLSTLQGQLYKIAADLNEIRDIKEHAGPTF